MSARQQIEVSERLWYMMKKNGLLMIVFLCSIFLAACGAKEDVQESAWRGEVPEEGISALLERMEYYDLAMKQEEIFDLGLWEKNSHEQHVFSAIHSGGTAYLPLGTQFYQGEPVQLWAEVTSKGSDVCLYRKDGSRELLLEKVNNNYTSADSKCQWYMDREGNFYCRYVNHPQINGEYKTQSSCVKILSSGEVLTANKMEVDVAIEDFCQTGDGRMYLLLKDQEDYTRHFLEEVDTATGLCIPESRIEIPMMQFQVYLGDGGDSPVVTGNYMEEGNNRSSSMIMKINPADGDMSLVLSFAGVSYALHDDLDLQDCRALEDGSVELIWTERNGTGGLLERLKMEKVKKDTIVVRGVFWQDDWFMKKVNQFNNESSNYHVIVEDCIDGRDQEDFFRITSVQIGAGKGPDILCGSQMPQGYVSGMLEKGALEELSPYMEASGIREEDYFPLTFATWREGEKIYGVNYRMSLQGEMIDEEILGNTETPDIETLVDALLALESDGVYHRGWGSGQVLNSFLHGTDSLWGMVDWESKTCDFNTPLFGRLLEAARRHGDDGRKSPENTIMNGRYLDCIVDYNRKSEGRVTSGVLFDDGCYAACYPSYTLAINGNSLHKEGAWEFIRFLIEEENQSADLAYHLAPVNRKAFEIWNQWSIYELTEMKYENGVMRYPAYYGTDVSEERQAEYIKVLEEARPLPMRTEPILEIILEEAGSYFNGDKSAEKVSEVINKRVQVYLDELR